MLMTYIKAKIIYFKSKEHNFIYLYGIRQMGKNN